MTKMTYEQLMEKIHGVSRFGSKLGLERMTKLMELLGNPQNSMKVIHIGGTNGKGSVSRYLSTVLLENGYQVGLYTSPFLERFSERIECNGEEISKEELITAGEEVFQQVDRMVNMGFDSPTEFEIVTAIGFRHFKNKHVDFVVLEVGLGGKGDSTNVVENPVATVITSIAYDHMEYLGDTLEKIAAEKAGILKSGVPMISNVKDQGAAETIKRMAEEKGCPFYGYPLGTVENLSQSMGSYTFDASITVENNKNKAIKKYENMAISMIGLHQVENALCALTVIEVLRNGNIINIEDKTIYAGMKKAVQTGRLEILAEKPYIIIDGAHNEAGAEALKLTIQEHFSGKKVLMVVGMLADKKVDKMLNHFCDIADDFVATEPDNERKLSAEALCKAVLDKGKNCIAISRTDEVCWYFKMYRKDYDVIIIAGSLYLIGAVRRILKNEEK